MIHESHPWKQDLIKFTKLLQKYNHTELLEWEDNKAYTIIEKSIFYSAFIIRKLIDCKCKVSDDVDNYKIWIEKIIPKKQMTALHHNVSNDTHDWGHTDKIQVSGKEICNWLIHSAVFALLTEDDTVESFVVSSDYDMNKALYRIKIDDWINCMTFVGTDYAISLHSEYSKKTHDREFTEKMRET